MNSVPVLCILLARISSIYKKQSQGYWNSSTNVLHFGLSLYGKRVPEASHGDLWWGDALSVVNVGSWGIVMNDFVGKNGTCAPCCNCTNLLPLMQNWPHIWIDSIFSTRAVLWEVYWSQYWYYYSLVCRACNKGDLGNLLWQKAGPSGGAAAALWASIWAVLRKLWHCEVNNPQALTVPRSWGKKLRIPGQFSVMNTKSEHVLNPK